MYKIQFNSCWAEDINEYLETKEKSGYTTKDLIYVFKKFDNFCIENNINTKIFTKEHAAKIRINNDNIKHVTFYKYINSVKNFLIAMAIKGYNVIPPRDISRSRDQLIPYIYTKDEIIKYFRAVDTYDYGKSGVMAISLPVIFRILYCCGTRITETLNIKKQDVDLSSGVIKLTKTKNCQERYVIVPEQLRILLMRYAEKTYWKLEDSSPIFKLGPCGNLYYSIYRYHREFLNIAKIPYKGEYRGPRIHDFRHTSIVLSCKKMIDLGYDMHVALPILSTWAGHTNIKSTEYYLRLTSEIFPYLKEKLSDTWETIFKDMEISDEIY